MKGITNFAVIGVLLLASCAADDAVAAALGAEDIDACVENAESSGDRLDCTSNELHRQEARLAAAYEADLAVSVNPDSAREAQQQWAKLRDAECDGIDDGGTAAGAGIYVSCLLNETTARADKLEARAPSPIADKEPKVAMESSLSRAEVMHYATQMYHAYKHGGLYHMQEFENECWENAPAGDRKGAGRCATYAMTGGLIDGTYAASQGRPPVQYYQGDAIVFRIKDKCRLPEDGMKSVIRETFGQMEPILIGLASAGM